MAYFNFNKAIIGGRLTADPELRQTTSGIPVCAFRVAVNRPRKEDGKQAETDFLTVKAWRKQAELVSTHFKKGSNICISGSIRTNQFKDKNGNNRTELEISAEEIYFVDSKDEIGGGKVRTEPVKETEKAGSLEEVKEDEELPF